jgi:uncharacterized protein YlxW (UPF0749 family)
MTDDKDTDRQQPRRTRVRAGVLIGVLTAVLGFAIAVQVHANSQSDSLSSLREDDLINILDNQNARGDQLRQQVAQLEQTLARLQTSGDKSAAARQQAEQEAAQLAILLGTQPAQGPGVSVVIADPRHVLKAEDLLDVVEELRGAGAEAIDFGGVRVSTSTAFTNVGSAVAVDGVVLAPPYRVLAIGDAKTLDTALNIPGGVAATIRAAGGDIAVTEKALITITSVRTLPTTRYLKPGQ